MSTTDLPGSSLLAGRYRLVERLGAGGMSVVWRGFDEVLGRQVAVKVLPPSTSADPSFRRRLRAEAQAAARLSHPNITNVYDYGEATTVDGEPVPYVVMELVDGESLAALLARVRRLPWPAAVRICSEVAAALAAAHSRGIVHRDVTPANVMLTSTGAKVVDFGISALIGENDIDPDGSLLGTPAYLAPERLEGGQVSPATDVYAVGLLIYRILIGQLPWDVGTTTALLRAHQYTEPEPLPRVEGMPAAVDALVTRCLEKRPVDRPSSAEVAQVLAEASALAPGGGAGYGDWADNGEDTTILPSQHRFTDGFGRVRPGHAKVADATPIQTGRGVAAVRSASAQPAGQPAAGMYGRPASPSSDAPVSPAPGPAVPSGPVSFGVPPVSYPATAPAPPPPPPGRAGGNARNNRFGGAAAPAAGGSALAAQPAPSAPHGMAFAGSGGPSPLGQAPAGPLRRAYDADDDDRRGPGGGGDEPPSRRDPRHDDYDDRGRLARTPGGRRVLVLVGAVVALGVMTYAFSLAATAGKRTNATPQPQPSLVGSSKCVVSYAVWSDTGKNFKASLTIANRDSSPVSDWKLWFIMPGDQTMSGNGKARLLQADRAVTVSDKGALNPQQSMTVQLTGRYDAANSAPMVFQLNKETCQAYVASKPGQPSRPVQRAADGSLKLGPVPATRPAVVLVNPGTGGTSSGTPSSTPSATPSNPPPSPPGKGDEDPDPSGSTSSSASPSPSATETETPTVPPPGPRGTGTAVEE
jgi:serine/threonine-protein kinase